MDRDNNKLINKEYSPLGNVKGFLTLSDIKGDIKYVVYQNKSLIYKLQIKPQGFVPKSGLLVTKSIERKVKNKKVLDMCTGETGIIAIHSALYGAQEVHAVDVEKEIINWASLNGKLNGFGNIKWKVNNLFVGIKDKYDLIVSNPPQMPMKKGHIHDWGGKNGRSFIEKIIKSSPEHLNPGGSLFMLIFDFLGVEKSYSILPPLKSIAASFNMQMEIIQKVKRKIRKGGQTEKSLDYILKQYPKYKFQKSGTSLYHYIYICKFTLSN